MESWDRLIREYGGFKGVFDRFKDNKREMIEILNKYFIGVEPVYQYIGIKIVDFGEGYSRIEFPKSPKIMRWGGIVNGGVIMTAIDLAIGLAVMTVNEGYNQYTAELKINFLQPLKEGPFTSIGKVIRKGRTLVVGEAEVLDSQGKLCAKGLGTWFIVK